MAVLLTAAQLFQRGPLTHVASKPNTFARHGADQGSPLAAVADRLAGGRYAARQRRF
jgi:hypothetical protein